jgi:molybdopterin converting factor small subunit
LARTAIDEFVNAHVTSLAKQLTEVTNRRDRLQAWAFKVVEWLGIETLREDVVRAKIISMHTDAARIDALVALNEQKAARIAALESESAQYREAAEKAEKECERLREIPTVHTVQELIADLAAAREENERLREDLADTRIERDDNALHLESTLAALRARPDDGRVERASAVIRREVGEHAAEELARAVLAAADGEAKP